jgi:polysaccharide export outer membrane protein
MGWKLAQGGMHSGMKSGEALMVQNIFHFRKWSIAILFFSASVIHPNIHLVSYSYADEGAKLVKLADNGVHIPHNQPADLVSTSTSESIDLAKQYRLNPEDVIKISVWKEEDLQGEVLVRPDGGISFPLVGDLKAGGKTIQELQKEIAVKIQRYIPEAVVSVSLVKLAGLKVYVIGKVNKPGLFVIGDYVDVMQALSLAGGVTPYADYDKIKILRRKHDEKIVFPFAYTEVAKGKKLEQNIVLETGDVVVVP